MSTRISGEAPALESSSHLHQRLPCRQKRATETFYLMDASFPIYFLCSLIAHPIRSDQDDGGRPRDECETHLFRYSGPFTLFAPVPVEVR